MLRSRSGLKQVMRNAHHENIKNIKQLLPAFEGQKITLSIDMRLQYVAYRELKSAVANHQASSGSIVILDTQTGEVLALANQPSYNANDRKQFIPEHMRNRGIIDLYVPCSVVKPFTIMAALESGDYDLDSIIDTSPGKLYFNNDLVSDEKDYGEIDLATILSKSSNVGTSKIAIGLGDDQETAIAKTRKELSDLMVPLGQLRLPIDKFFEDVVVNDDNPAVRSNRLGLLAMVRHKMLRVADFTKLEG